MGLRLSRFAAVVASLFMVVTCGVSAAQAEELNYTIPSGGDFHPPRSGAEKTLDAILKREGSESDGGMMYYLLDIPHRDFKKDSDYGKLFTPALRKAASEAEAEMVKETCGGVYEEGELCGLDFDPIICAQDIPEYYLYRVEQLGADKAVVTLGFAQSMKDQDPYPAATYSVVRQGKGWVIDGILCQGWSGYNFTDFDAIKGLTSKPREP